MKTANVNAKEAINNVFFIFLCDYCYLILFVLFYFVDVVHYYCP